MPHSACLSTPFVTFIFLSPLSCFFIPSLHIFFLLIIPSCYSSHFPPLFTSFPRFIRQSAISIASISLPPFILFFPSFPHFPLSLFLPLLSLFLPFSPLPLISLLRQHLLSWHIIFFSTCFPPFLFVFPFLFLLRSLSPFFLPYFACQQVYIILFSSAMPSRAPSLPPSRLLSLPSSIHTEKLIHLSHDFNYLPRYLVRVAAALLASSRLILPILSPPSPPRLHSATPCLRFIIPSVGRLPNHVLYVRAYQFSFSSLWFPFFAFSSALQFSFFLEDSLFIYPFS